MQIHDVHDFDPARGAKEVLDVGFTVIDDIAENLYDCAFEELQEELGFAGDGMDLVIDRIETSCGAVFVFRERDVLPIPGYEPPPANQEQAY